MTPTDELLKVLVGVDPCGIPLQDHLYLVRASLSDPDPEQRARARDKIKAKLRVQQALLSVYQSSVVNRAKELGHGRLPFTDAAAVLGEEFETLRDVYVLQLDSL